MKIVISIPCFLQGGTEMQTLSLTEVLLSYGHTVELICYFEHEELVVSLFRQKGAGVKLLEMDRKSGFIKIIIRLKREMQSINPDIVHVQYMAPGALPIIAARLAGVKIVFATVHQPYTKSHGIFSKLILRIASLLTTRFIAVSQNAEESWFGSSSLFDENKPLKTRPKHFTIYNSVDADRIHNIAIEINTKNLRKKIGVPPEVCLIGTVARLRYEKGIDILIAAFVLLVKDGINAFLLIVGSGPDEEKLKTQATSCAIHDKIMFYGSAEREKVFQLFSIMDIVVVPSRFEGFGLTAAEAMAVGKPVIASDSFGLKEVVINNETGLNFRSNDPEDLAMKLKLLLSNREMRRQYGTAGQMRVKSLFDAEVFQKKIAVLYDLYLS